jgi:hypothetical protein
MRHALALALTAPTALALMASCAESSSAPMQPDPGTGYTVTTTGADVVGVDVPSSTNVLEPSNDMTAARLAAQICDREVRCHALPPSAPPRSAQACWRESLGRAKRELDAWRCSPAGARARAEACLAAIGNEPCEYDLARHASLCASNSACGRDVPPPPGSGMR